MIEITNEQINRVNLLLSEIPKGSTRAFTGAINRGLGTIKTQTGKSVTKRYRILRKDLNAETNLRQKKATQSNMVGEIAYAGGSIPLIKFKVNPKQPQRKTVSVAVLKETGGTVIRRAFVAKMKSGHIGVFERASAKVKRLPIGELYGPSAAGMISNEGNIKEIETAAQETIDKRIEHEISRILNGYGG